MTSTVTEKYIKTLLAQAKWAFSARRVDQVDVKGMKGDFDKVQAGDLILGRVSKIGQHRGIQLTTGRRAKIAVGDVVVLPCAARYAPDQFEGVAEIDSAGADMLAGGGCLGRMRERNERIKPATKVVPVGRLINSEGKPINVADYAMPSIKPAKGVPVIAVLGTAMNSGKTTATAELSRGLRQAGLKVGTIKGTGTGAFGDYHAYVDSGAHFVADFTDAGLATTYMVPLSRVKTCIDDLIGNAEKAGCDVVVMELADGLFQLETAALIADPVFRQRIDSVVFACGDAVAAAGGVAHLRQLAYEPAVLTGMLSCSPMAAQEARNATDCCVLGKSELADPAHAIVLYRGACAHWQEAG